MTERIRLEADAHTPRVARTFVCQCLLYWGYDSIVTDAEMLTSEVVTNAVLHAGGLLVVELDDLRDGVLVVVEDPGAALPIQRSPGPLDGGGRGLQIVDALASAWGVARMRGDGKYVWFRLAMAGPLSPLRTVAGGG